MLFKHCKNNKKCNEQLQATAVACMIKYSRRSDCLHTPYFIQQFIQKQVMEDSGKEMRALAQEIGIEISTMKLALNENIRCHVYKRRKGHLLAGKARENRRRKEKKLQNKVEPPVESGRL